MDLKSLPVSNKKDISLKVQEQQKKKKTYNVQLRTVKPNAYIPKTNIFSKNQRKKIRSGNKVQITKLKRRMPQKFNCSNCSFSNSANDTSRCYLFKAVITDPESQGYECESFTI